MADLSSLKVSGAAGAGWRGWGGVCCHIVAWCAPSCLDPLPKHLCSLLGFAGTKSCCLVPKASGQGMGWPQASRPLPVRLHARTLHQLGCSLICLLHFLPTQVTGTGSSEKPIWRLGTRSHWPPTGRASPMTELTLRSGGSPRGTPSSSVGTGTCCSHQGSRVIPPRCPLPCASVLLPGAGMVWAGWRWDGGLLANGFLHRGVY